jgi:dienelactone hydrolase
MVRAHLLVLLVAAAIACGRPPRASAPAPTPAASAAMLPAGPHPVGFRATWTFDPARPYRTEFDDGKTYAGPRPILVNVWYPAAAGGAATNRAAYLQPPDGPGVTALAAGLAAYVRDITASDAFGADEALLPDDARRRFAGYLAAPLTAVRDAAPAGGRFPIVVYHAGNGSSYADNAELCEYLASHGHVVLGSTFLSPDGRSYNVGEGWRDFDPLIEWAREHLPFADAARVVGLGHSAGAQAMLAYATRPAPRIRAFALLDTTMDYHGLEVPFHAAVPELFEHRAAVTTPLLVVAKPYAIFALVDAFDGADRTYLAVQLDHNEYLGHGVTRAAQPDAPADRAPRVLARYRAVAAAVRAFFDRELTGDRAAAAELAALAANPLGGEALHVEAMPRGARRPPPYDPSTSRAPTPRQFRDLVATRGAADAIDLARAHRDTDPTSPTYTSSELACSLLYELFARGQRDEARTLYAYFHELHPTLVDDLLLWAKLAGMFHRSQAAQTYTDAARLFEPDHRSPGPGPHAP